MYLAYNPDRNGAEPLGTNSKALRGDLTTDRGARAWMRRLPFFQVGVTELYRLEQGPASRLGGIQRVRSILTIGR